MELDDLLKKFKEYSSQDTTLLEYAWNYSCEAHQEQKRASGEKYFVHCAAVAEILVDYKMDLETVAAGLLHDVLEDTKIPHETFS
jgi:GTP pyrophosphokinase